MSNISDKPPETEVMKRDMDLMRKILLAIEAKDDLQPEEIFFDDEDDVVVARHVDLLVNEGFIEGTSSRRWGEPYNYWLVKDLTWDGHDFLDEIRDYLTWERTKKGVEEAGSFSFDLLKALAKGYARKKIEDTTGIKLDL